MFFTQEDYRKIEKWLLANSRKDTDFVGAATPLKGNETVVLVQDGKNVKTSVKDIVDQFFLLGVSDFLNITDKYGESYIPLTQAIQLIPFRSRKIGQVITFIDESGNWAIYQFQGKALNQWNNTTLWIDLIAKISGIPIIDSEDIITKENNTNQVSLYLADKQYNEADYSGLGRIYLRKNIQTIIDPSTGAVINVNLLTQSMLSKENTIYIIQYDYNLNNQTITIPEGCILDMRGGSVTNGTINCVDTIIISTDASKLDVTLTGTYRFDSEKLVTSNTEDININQSVDRKSHTISAMLADRDTTNGMGYVILRKYKTFAEQVTQENTIYEIRYDFDLIGDTVKIPSNCILKFEGGKVYNGILEGDNTKIWANIVTIFNDVTIGGTWEISESYPEWFGENGLFDSIEELERLSNNVRLTKAEYINNNNTTLKISKHLVSSINTVLRFDNVQEGFVAVQLGEVSTSASNRTKGVILDGVNIYISSVSTGVTKTACLGIGTITKSTIRNGQFKNLNLKVSEFTEEELENPHNYCNYAIIVNGNSDTTSFHNTITTADISIYLATHTDFLSWYDSDFMGSTYSYAAVYGEASDKLNFYSGAFAKCGLRGFDLYWDGNNVAASVLLDGCRFEQPRNFSGENSLWRMIKAKSEPSNNTRAMHFELNECMFCKGTIFEGIVTKGALCLTVNGGGFIQYYEETVPFILDVRETSILNIKFNGAHWVGNCPDWTYDDRFQYDGIAYNDYSGNKMLDLSNAHIYRNYGGEASLVGFPTSTKSTHVSEFKGSCFFNTLSTINKPVWWDGTQWITADGVAASQLRKGITSQRPSLTTSDSGFQFFDTTLKKPIWWDGTAWVDNMGFLAGLTRGTTAQRPSLGESDYGYMYYDNELMKYITWSGTTWMNIDGTPLT